MSAHLDLGRYQRQLGNSAEASRSFRDARDVLEHIPRETPQQLYELATVYAELAQPVEGEKAPTEDDAADRLRHLDLALQTLHKAADAGYVDAAAIKANRLFDALRERADFQKLVSTIDKAAQAQQLAAREEGTTDEKLADLMKAARQLGDVVNEQPGALTHRTTLAATHHSIAMIQMGLKQFDEAEASLQQALELRNAVRQAQPGKPELEVGGIGERVSLGDLYWKTGRFPDAHRIWQECSPKLLAIAEAHRDRAALQQQIGGLERLMGDAYANYGLWPLAREYAVRNSRFRRITRNNRDAEYAAPAAYGSRFAGHRRIPHVSWRTARRGRSGIALADHPSRARRRDQSIHRTLRRRSGLTIPQDSGGSKGERLVCLRSGDGSVSGRSVQRSA